MACHSPPSGLMPVPALLGWWSSKRLAVDESHLLFKRRWLQCEATAGWMGAHDVYYPFFPLPPPTASRRRTPGRRTSMERRERSRGRSAAKRERSRSRGRSRERLGGAGRRSPARKEAGAGAGVGEVGCLPFKGPAEAIASCGQEELPFSQEEEVPNPLPPEGGRRQREGALPSLPSFFHFPLSPRHRRRR